MKRPLLTFAIAAALSVVAAGPAAAQTSTGPARGQVTMTVHTHSGSGLFFPVDRLLFSAPVGETFSYSSRLCEGTAPFNDIGLNFIPDYPGVDDDDGTAYVRHRFAGTVTSSTGNGAAGSIQGTLTTVLCLPGNSPTGFVPSNHVIVSHVTASFQRVSPNDLRVLGGFQFSPTESTGTFRDIVGGGRFEGRFTCLSGTPTCAQRGEYTDFVGSTGDPNLGPGLLQPGLFGSYYDPTVTTVSSPSA